MPQFLTGPRRNLTRFGEVPHYREGLYRVGPSAYAWLVPNGSWGETNLGLVVCGKKSVLIDTCWDLKFTREALDAAADLLRDAPIEFVINTHADGDHCWGNQLFADKPILGTDACVRQFHQHAPRELIALGSAGKHLARLHVAGLSTFGHYLHHMFAPYDFRGLKLTPPNQPFSGQRSLQVDGVELVLLEVGPGHTAGDCLVYVPDQGVVYAADVLFVGVTPVAWSGPIENIISALKRVLALEPRVIVAGHGQLASPADVQHVIDYWEFAQHELWARRQRGMQAHEAARDVVRSSRFADSVFARWDSPERMVTSAYTLYRDWGDTPRLTLGPLRTLATLRQQALLAHSLPTATPRVMHTALAEAAEHGGRSRERPQRDGRTHT